MKLYTVYAMEDNNRKSWKNRKAWSAVIMAKTEEEALKIAKKHMYGDYVRRLENEGKLTISIREETDNIFEF